MKVLEEIKGRRRAGLATICVSTQLIEAGVDISFGLPSGRWPGLAHIAQAAGRCNRHGEMELGRVHVINLKGEVPRAWPRFGKRRRPRNGCSTRTVPTGKTGP